MKIKRVPNPIVNALSLLDDVDKLQHHIDEQTVEMPLSVLITRLDQVRNLHARLKEIASDVNQIAERLSTTLVPNAMREAGFTTVNHQVGRVSVSSRVSASMVEKHGAMAWLRDHELGDLIIETVNAQTLSAQAKAMIEAGEELPPDFFKISIKPTTSITKPGPKRARKFRPLEDDNAPQD